MCYNFPGIVVIDEAYVDFSSQDSWLKTLNQFPNLIVLQTFSKAWGMASVRCGMAFASPAIIELFNKVKYPYNINLLTQEKALDALADPFEVDNWVNRLLLERDRLISAFRLLPICEEVYPTEANFFLARMNNAQEIYNYLVEKGIIVRNRNKVSLCQNCLRITVGTKSENNELLGALRQY